MERLKKAAGTVLAILCLALFAMAVVGNLFVSSVQEETLAAALEPVPDETATWEDVYTGEQMQQEAVESAAEVKGNIEEITEEEQMKNQIASLRMMRDRSWQKLQRQLEEIPEAEKQQQIQRIAMLQYKEQRIELLLAAKGFEHTLVVLEEEQANIIAEAKLLEKHYEKLYDIVLRNSEYPPEQIVLIPLAENSV